MKKNNNNKKRVLIITNIPSPYRVDLFHYLESNVDTFKFHIIFTSYNENNRQWDSHINNLKEYTILPSKILHFKTEITDKYIHIPFGMNKELNRINPDVIIGAEYNLSTLLSLFWAKLHKKKFINLSDGTLYSERNCNGLQKSLRKLVIKFSDAYIASSTKTVEKFKFWGADEKKIFISLLTEDLTKFNNIKNKYVNGRLLYVGFIIKLKGLDLLFNAIATMKEDFCLHIVGDGPTEYKNELKLLANKLKISNRIIWCGYKEGEDLLKEYEEASAFVFPSREDCYGLVVLEAASSRVPIVASKYADGAYDIIEDGVNGVIVDPNETKIFGDAISKTLSSTYDRSKLINRKMDMFEFKNTINGYIDAINSILV